MVKASRDRLNRAEPQSRQTPEESEPSTGKIVIFSLLGIGIILAAIVGSGISAGSDPEETSVASSETSVAGQEPQPEASLPTIGDPVRDGKFEFVVVDVENPGTRYNPDNGIFYSEAEGTWLIVKVLVTNIGKERQQFSGRDQLLFWGLKEYSPSLSLSHATLYESLNPDVSVEATIMFDVPESFPDLGEGTVLELHDSLFSDGVQIEL